MISTSKINILGKNILFIFSSLCLIFYSCHFSLDYLLLVFFFLFLELTTLSATNYFRGVVDSFIPAQFVKVIIVFVYGFAGTFQHPSYILLTGKIPEENYRFDKEEASQFLSYKFLSDKQKKFYDYHNQERINIVKRQIAVLNKEIEDLKYYKKSMNSIVEKGLGQYKEINHRLLMKLKKDLDFKKDSLKELEEELVLLNKNNKQWEKENN